MGSALGLFMIAVGAVTLIAHLVMAFSVYMRAEHQRLAHTLRYMPAFFWFVVTLLTGLMGLMAFWFIHDSALREPKEPPRRED